MAATIADLALCSRTAGDYYSGPYVRTSACLHMVVSIRRQIEGALLSRNLLRGTSNDKFDLTTIPGWFLPQDQKLFRWFLGEQERRHITADLAELGVYMGKSAVVIGQYLRPGETFTIIDLFESPACDDENRVENANIYAGLTQRAFEANYLRFHERLPIVVKAPSSEILDHASAGAHRFVHVDASHLYEHVRTDVASARALLHESGVVAFDDIQSHHTPGVAAAVWSAVDSGGLRPIAISQGKMYGTWGSAVPWQEAFLSWLPSSGLAYEVQQVAGAPLIRVWRPVVARPGVVRAVARSLLPRVVLSHVRQYRRRRDEARSL
jgi:Methyltransferase domain